jgi:hypothetical protein
MREGWQGFDEHQKRVAKVGLRKVEILKTREIGDEKREGGEPFVLQVA